MQNSLKRNLKNNLKNFNKNFSNIVSDENISSEYKSFFDSDSDPNYSDFNTVKIDKKNILDLTIGEIILEIRNMFLIILELVSKKKNPYNFIFSTSKRKYIFSLFLIVFGCLLLLLSTLMMEKN